MRLQDSNLLVLGTKFIRNSASQAAGGMYTYTQSKVNLTVRDSLFQQNTMSVPVGGATLAFTGGAWFSQGSPICLEGCPTEHVAAYNTTFIRNSASEGAAIYMLSAASHKLDGCQWIDNYGLQPYYLLSVPEGIKSRGAAVYSGLLSMRLTIKRARMINNTAMSSSAVCVRASIFGGWLTISKSFISDMTSATVFKFSNCK